VLAFFSSFLECLVSRPFTQTSSWCLGAKTSWASGILRAFEGLRSCDTCTQAFLQGLPICFSDFTADLRFRMRKVWGDIASMNPLESDNKLVTYHSWFASPLLDLQANSHTRVPKGGAPLMPSRYLYLDLPKHVMRNVSTAFVYKKENWQFSLASTQLTCFCSGILHLARC